MQRIANGDEAAFTVIYQFYSDTVFHTAMLYVRDEVEAREIVQQIFVRFWEYRAQLATVNDLHNYFFIATRNRVMDHINHLARTQKALSALKAQMNAAATTGEDSTTRFLQQKHYTHLLETAITKLPAQQKQVYRMAEEDALSTDEIAGQLSLSRHTVKKHLELARKGIRRYIRHFLLHDFIGLLCWLATFRLIPIIL